MQPHELSAAEAVRAMRGGSLSPRELLTDCITQIERIDPVVNAMVVRAFERALVEATAATEALGRGRRVGALCGLPIAVKDIHATAGVRTTFGAREFADNVPTHDSNLVRRLRAAGGIVIGKTNVPEHSIGANTVNRLFGATGNPFAPERTCGGSSGGSAVALATEMAPLATGSDHGGSLRIPASFCGVVGFRGTPGLVPNETRGVAHTTYSVPGPMARTVEDVGLMLSVLTGRDAQSRLDPMAYPVAAERFASLPETDLGAVRAAFTADYGGVLVSATIRETFAERMAVISHAFDQAQWCDLDLTEAPDVDWQLRQELLVAQYRDVADQWDDDFNPNIRASYDAAAAAPLADFAAARVAQMALMQRCATLLETADVIIAPGVSVPPFPWRFLNPPDVDGTPVANYMAWLALTSAISVVGLPVASVPCGLDAQGTPFGIQVIGRRYDDERLLSVCAALERVLAADPRTVRPRPDFDALAATPSTCATQGKLVQSGGA